jgi:hypothetical protein
MFDARSSASTMGLFFVPLNLAASERRSLKMEMEMNVDLAATVGETVDRLTAAASLLEQTVERLETKIAALEAAMEAGAPSFRAAEGAGGGRKTLPTQMTTLLSKQGVSIDSIEAGTLDAALSSLSLEQRIAVKSQLIRAGLLG